MQQDIPALAADIDTVSELRELYRAAEARAARLRLLSSSARTLIESDADQLGDALQTCLDRLAIFLGRRSARLVEPGESEGLAIISPRGSDAGVALVTIDGIAALSDIADREDRETCRTLLEMMGSAIDRMEREREMAQLLELVKDREKRLELLVGRIFNAQEAERRRVAYDLHDGVAQSATALVRMIEGSGGGSSSDPDDDRRAELAGIARELVRELRGVIAGLRPTVLDDLGLVPAIEALAQALRQEGYDVDCQLIADPERLEASEETALFRVAQEAVTNIRKHAGGPCKVVIEANIQRGASERFLRIIDRGKGASDSVDTTIEPGDGRHIGIEGMTERMSAIGGSLDWSAQEAKGVRVEASLGGAIVG